MKTKDILIRLIEDNLRTTKLVDALNNIQLYGSEYYNHHHIEIVFNMMEIEHTNENSELYQIESEKVADINIEDSARLEQLSNEIYNLLIKLKVNAIK